MTRRLDLYVLRRFLGFYGTAVLWMLGLYLVVDGVTRMDDFLEAGDDIRAQGGTIAGAVATFYAAEVPLALLRLAPFATVLGASMAMVDLRRRNEYGPMLGAGRSPGRVLLPVLAFAAAATVVLVWAHDRIAPRALERRNGVERMIRGEQRSATFRVPHVRDSAGNCWAILEWDPANAAATRVRVVPYRSGGREWDLLEVPTMRWREGPGGRGWYPEGGGRLLAGRGGDDGVPRADAPLDTDLRPEHIELARASSELEGLSARRLRALRERHPDLPHLAVLDHRRLTYPLANLVLVLVGVPLVLRGRGSSLFFPVLAALGVCAGFYAVDAAACDLGVRGAVAPGLASWFATVLFGAAGLALLDGAGEDG